MNKSLLVQQARSIMGLKQSELSNMLGVNHDEVSKWERNIRVFPDSRVFDLMYFFELVTGDNEKTLVLFSPYIKDIVRRRNDKV